MAVLQWSVTLLLLLSLACTETDASCDSGDVCCRNCASECPLPADRIACTSKCVGVPCSEAQMAQCGSGQVCCDDCETECPGMPASCESNCLSFPPPLSCPAPAPECSKQDAVLCEDCATKCPGHPATCERFCKDAGASPPAVEGLDCLKAGVQVARALKDTACSNTKIACGVADATRFTTTASAPVLPVTVETCCLAIMGTCSGDIVDKFECDSPGNYGTCVDFDGFQKEYIKQAELLCKDRICSIPECAEELEGRPECS